LANGRGVAEQAFRGCNTICARPDNTVEEQKGILKYLIEHPLAKDTVEGIVQWWFPDLPQQATTDDVQTALDTLVKKGWVVVTKRSPGSVLYGLEESRLEEIREFLNG